MMRAIAFTLMIIGGMAGTALAAPAKDSSRVGRKIDGFSLRDHYGKEHSLGDAANDKLVVIAFLGTECPLAGLYAPRLVELEAQYGPKGVVFFGVDSNCQDSVTELTAFVQKHQIKFPVLMDPSNAVADKFGTVRNPEVVLLDRDRVIRYAGRIDDQYGFQKGVGYARPKAEQKYLADALDAVFENKEVACTNTETIGCLLGRSRKPDENASVTYSKQISRLFQKHCSECHRAGQIAPFPLLTYQDTVGWSDMIDETVQGNRMPPWHADVKYGHWSNSRNMTQEEKDLIHQWVLAGAPEGDPKDLPEARTYHEGWTIKPDQVVWMSDEPCKIPAEGTIQYKYFHVDPGFKEDVWVKAAECQPGCRSVVHHIIVFVQPPGALASFGGNQQPINAELLLGYAPGLPASEMPPGMAFHVKAGSKFIFQMHYTANGTEQLDRSCVGLVFADPKEVNYRVTTEPAVNPFFEIPAHADNHRVDSSFRFRRDSQLVMLMPHLHLRGKSFRYDLEYPNGQTETLLDIPQYDFNWQNAYYFAEPKKVPAGTTMRCVAHFDNSENNLANPDPTKPVRWGDQTWEEMMIGWFSVTTDAEPAADVSGDSRAARFDTGEWNPEGKDESGCFARRKRALVSNRESDRFGKLVPTMIPQVDRVCVAELSDGKMRFVQVGQSPVLDIRVGHRNTEVQPTWDAYDDLAGLEEVRIVDDWQKDISKHLGNSKPVLPVERPFPHDHRRQDRDRELLES
ncbi:MAG: redoxin domain-containing protein [Planctomycetota bacterium]